ncbi:MAG: hypothetical protein GX321_00180 [Clostridiales bacterium]|nr:hypothetical protein [Clostridiales bacterium]
MNKKSQIYQNQSNLAASIMEGLKTYSIEEIIQTFNEPKELFKILPPSTVDSITQLILDSDNKYIPGTSSEQTTCYFAIHGIRASGSAYDVLIRIDASPYDKDIIVDGNVESILNNYLLPELINLDEKANGILFSNGNNVQNLIRKKKAENNDDIPVEDIQDNLDQNVLDLIVQQGTLFAETTLLQTPKYLNYINERNQWENDCEEAIMRGEPTPAPTFVEPTISDPDLDLLKYTREDDIKKMVTKNMKVTVSDKELQYEIEYICDFNDGRWEEIRISHNIDQIEFSTTLENVYLAYEESIFHERHLADKIFIRNKDITKPVNFFVADQGNIILHYPIVIDRQDGDSIAVHTDVSQYEPYVEGVEVVEEYPELIRTYDLNRIFDITIDICKAEREQDNRYKEVYYSLKSTKER